METADRLTEAAGGNPLFVEQMLSMLIDDGRLIRQNGGWIPAGDLHRSRCRPRWRPCSPHVSNA